MVLALGLAAVVWFAYKVGSALAALPLALGSWLSLSVLLFLVLLLAQVKLQLLLIYRFRIKAEGAAFT